MDSPCPVQVTVSTYRTGYLLLPLGKLSPYSDRFSTEKDICGLGRGAIDLERYVSVVGVAVTVRSLPLLGARGVLRGENYGWKTGEKQIYGTPPGKVQFRNENRRKGGLKCCPLNTPDCLTGEQAWGGGASGEFPDNRAPSPREQNLGIVRTKNRLISGVNRAALSLADLLLYAPGPGRWDGQIGKRVDREKR
ncbi:hypothetical protein J6590_057386 [Homalodisca vitripennis]|nr:hypothetical protein J6590_057386 [Homalodisca vitripennis]